MRNVLLGIFILSVISCNKIPQEIIIPMKTEVSGSPFCRQAMAPKPNKIDTVTMDGVIEDLERVDIRKIDFQRNQSGKIKQDVYFFVGEKDDKTILKIDANNNGTFKDDKVFEFKNNLSPTEIELIKEDLPIVTVDYEYLKDGKISNLQSTLMVTPYEKSVIRLKRGGKWIDPFENEKVITFLEMDYKKAEIEINGKQYQVAVDGTMNKYKTDSEATQLLIIGKDEKFPSTYFGFVPIKVGEEFVLGDLKYKFSDVTDLGDTLRLNYVGKVTEDKPTGVNVGFYATDFQKPTVDLKPFQLSEHKGNYVLIDFWGTWCNPCIASLPKLRKIHSDYSKKGLTVLSVAYDNNLDKVKQGIIEHDLTWNNIYQHHKDTSQYALTKLFKVDSFPTLILIDPEGKIVFRLSGNYADKYNELINLLDGIYNKASI